MFAPDFKRFDSLEIFRTIDPNRIIYTLEILCEKYLEGCFEYPLGLDSAEDKAVALLHCAMFDCREFIGFIDGP